MNRGPRVARAAQRFQGGRTAHLSALWIVPLAHPLFGYPLMADASEVNVVITPKP